MTEHFVTRGTGEFQSYISALEALHARFARLKDKIETNNPDAATINPKYFELIAEKAPELRADLGFWLGTTFEEVSSSEISERDLPLAVDVLTEAVHLRVPQNVKAQIRYMFCVFSIDQIEDVLKNSSSESREFFETFIQNAEVIFDKARR